MKIIILTFCIAVLIIQGQDITNPDLGIKYTRKATSQEASIDEVSGQVLGDLTTELQVQSQNAFNSLQTNPAAINTIVQNLAMEMATSIAALIDTLLQQGITNPIEEAAQISAAVRLALEATLSGVNGMLSNFDVIQIVNQLVGELEDILIASSDKVTLPELTQRVMTPLQVSLQQAFGIPVTPVAPAQPLSPPTSTVVTPTPTPTPTPAPSTNVPGPSIAAPSSVSTPPGNTIETFIFTPAGQRRLVGGCFDIVPPGGFTCEEQSALGKCGRRWMTEGTFCAQTCGYCENQCFDIQPNLQQTCQEVRELGLCGSANIISNGFCRQTCNSCEGTGPPTSAQPTAPTPVVPVPVGPEPCTDVPPDSQYSCARQKEFGKCNASWMVQGEFCKKTCGRCDSQATVPTIPQVVDPPPGCFDIPPDSKYTCVQQRDFGKCEAQWMLAGGFCKLTCNRCDTTSLPQQQTDQCPCDCEANNNNGVGGTGLQSETVAQLLAIAIEQVLQDLGV
eukprot:TRINITY_DN3428_c0_g1_i1.p1 TRINITY_DN3428_c0_g1~~TRINITY_DN3428_c0_g1_i1.p1  ORF type:complete len:505 (-),score=42.76 TRINITY_DN3428_c0_g1_i1:1199-2713(-)